MWDTDIWVATCLHNNTNLNINTINKTKELPQFTIDLIREGGPCLSCSKVQSAKLLGNIFQSNFICVDHVDNVPKLCSQHIFFTNAVM